eukprot:g15791.t1
MFTALRNQADHASTISEWRDTLDCVDDYVRATAVPSTDQSDPSTVDLLSGVVAVNVGRKNKKAWVGLCRGLWKLTGGRGTTIGNNASPTSYKYNESDNQEQLSFGGFTLSQAIAELRRLDGGLARTLDEEFFGSGTEEFFGSGTATSSRSRTRTTMNGVVEEELLPLPAVENNNNDSTGGLLGHDSGGQPQTAESPTPSSSTAESELTVHVTSLIDEASAQLRQLGNDEAFLSAAETNERLEALCMGLLDGVTMVSPMTSTMPPSGEKMKNTPAVEQAHPLVVKTRRKLEGRLHRWVCLVRLIQGQEERAERHLRRALETDQLTNRLVKEAGVRASFVAGEGDSELLPNVEVYSGTRGEWVLGEVVMPTNGMPFGDVIGVKYCDGSGDGKNMARNSERIRERLVAPLGQATLRQGDQTVLGVAAVPPPKSA